MVKVSRGPANGRADAPPRAAGPTPKRMRWIEMPDEYGEAGWSLLVWVNHPPAYGQRLIAQTEPFDEEAYPIPEERERARADHEARAAEAVRLRQDALSKIVAEHNGWLQGDDDPEPGAPYPPADTPEFWELVPNELAASILVLLSTEILRLPNSIAARSRR